MAIIGIDLGTSNSAAAVLRGGRPVLIPSAEGISLGGKAFPSYVAIAPDGQMLVGEPARRQTAANPEGTATAFKRKMGQRVKVQLRDREFSPEQLSAFLLQKIKRDAEAFLGEPVDKAVVTVPAYFDDNQRSATKDACGIAGLDVVRLVNEPTAAALAYGLDRLGQELRIVVIDFGGGTLDVTIMEFGKGVFEVEATSGDYARAGQTLRDLISRYPKSFLVNQAVYWQGRASEKQGDLPGAAAYYRKALKRSPYTYYGYLAAERLGGIEPLIQTEIAEAEPDAGPVVEPVSETLPADTVDGDGPPVWADEAVKALGEQPSFRKTLELMSLEMKKEAAAELWDLQDRVQKRRGMLLGLSKTFFELGDYYRSLLLVLRNYEHYLGGPAGDTPRDFWLLAYPQGHWESVVSHARAYGQDPYFISAIIRQESYFQTDALSPAGARGIMQVMPSTGEWIARTIRLPGFERGKLFETDMNINIGTWYVGRLMKRYRNDPLLVAAAYNAGPAAVSGWIGKLS